MKKRLINSHTVFVATLIVVPTLTLIIYLTGLEQHRSLYLNSLLSTTILSIVLIIFLATGLYKGWKLKDSIGELKPKRNPDNFPDIGGLDGFHLPDVGEGIAGIILGILLWIIIAILATVVLYFVTSAVWLTVLALGSVLYWIVFRAFRLVFKKGPWCKDNMMRSVATAIAYTFLYNCWIYAIIIGVHFLRNN